MWSWPAVTLTHRPAAGPQRPHGTLADAAYRRQERTIVFRLLSLSNYKRQRFGGWWLMGKVTPGSPEEGAVRREGRNPRNSGFQVPEDVTESLQGTRSFPYFCIYSACLFESLCWAGPFGESWEDINQPDRWICVLPIVTGRVRSSPSLLPPGIYLQAVREVGWGAEGAARFPGSPRPSSWDKVPSEGDLAGGGGGGWRSAFLRHVMGG